MALTQKGNRVYARITDLSEEGTLNDGDKLIFHSSSTGNACIVDWANVKVDLEHCTFGNTFSEVLNFTQTASAWVDTMTESFSEVEATSNEVKESVLTITNELEAIKMVLKMMLGIINDREDNVYEEFLNTLSTEAREVYDKIISDVEENQKDGRKFNFVTDNIMSLTSN